MRKTHDIVATVGSYRNGAGEEKKRYVNCGAVFKGDDGRVSMKLESVPVSPEWSGWFALYPVDRERRPASSTPPSERPRARRTL